MMTTINNGLNKRCKVVKALYEDRTHKDFISMVEARKSTDVSTIGEVLKGKYKTSEKDDDGKQS